MLYLLQKGKKKHNVNLVNKNLQTKIHTSNELDS